MFLDYLVKEGNLYELKRCKKSQEEARLQQLKQEMRNSTDNLVSNAKNNVALKSQTLNEIIETINNSSQNLEGTF
ncbi:TPA: hypothetical protein O4963_002669, partial [Staphylococcus aureus]|nr:hypothetical protein [Staphylococcus aureus]